MARVKEEGDISIPKHDLSRPHQSIMGHGEVIVLARNHLERSPAGVLDLSAVFVCMH